MPHAALIALIPLLPLFTFVLLGLFGRKYFSRTAGIIGTLSLLVSFAIAAYVAYGYFTDYGRVNDTYQKLVPFSYQWLQFREGLSIDMGMLLDPISVMMLVVVTFVSLMVHVYSIGYMKGEERFATYFSFLSLFTFSMLGLVLSSNIFQIYIFWELVGVSSFLLIGFYYDRPGAVAASKKAFIVTRFADLGFLVGILILSFFSGTLDFATLIERLTTPGSDALATAIGSTFLGVSALTWGLALVFVGGAGKSAMFPLHIWLPDAMEGPTPVSALIHAATMVVAGVFLVGRLFPVFALSAPDALDIVAYVGVLSAFLAAIIACVQTDIKRVLAYSTMSQIGFMMFALGVSGYGGEAGAGYSASMFHLFTHAMFKALLFLGAGVVIHFVHTNELTGMGGLRKYLPVTHITFLVACLAIAGVPPLSGFFSKEAILLAAWENNPFIYWTALATSGLTAFYMFRLYFSIFWKRDDFIYQGHHEGSTSMKLPLVILAVFAAIAGFVPFNRLVTSDGRPFTSEFHLQFAVAPVVLGLLGIGLAMWLYKKHSDAPERLAASFKGLYQLASRKFYVDEIYLFVTKKVLFNMVGRPAAWFDRNVVDGLVNASGNATQAVAEKIRIIQSGKVQQYAIYFLSGVLVLAVIFIYLWKI
ncbi:MAG TPA: NADH-quinone oxidoreductase subunit L [Flavisolibacter sp.]